MVCLSILKVNRWSSGKAPGMLSAVYLAYWGWNWFLLVHYNSAACRGILEVNLYRVCKVALGCEKLLPIPLCACGWAAPWERVLLKAIVSLRFACNVLC